MKVDIKTSESVQIESGDYTYYFNFSVEGEASLLRYLTNSDMDLATPEITWTDGSDAIEIDTTSYRLYDEWVRECEN